MIQPGRDDAWLRALSKALGFSTQKPPLPKLPSTYSATWSQEEGEKGSLLLTEAAEKRKKGNSRSLTSGKLMGKKTTPAYEDYCTVLLGGIGPGSTSIGVLKSVWHSFQTEKPKKARSGTIIRKKATDDDHSVLMQDLIRVSLEHHDLDALQLFAHFADSHIVSSFLATGIRQRDLDIIRVLIEESGDPNACAHDFQASVEAGHVDIIRLLLQSKTSMAPATTTSALPAAVEVGNVEMVNLLLAKGADANFNDGVALKNAIDSSRVDIILPLLLCNSPPSESTLASMVSYSFALPQMPKPAKYDLIEMLLNGGAAGQGVDIILSGAVQQRWGELVKLLLDKGTSIAASDGGAFRYAVQNVDLEILHILNSGKLGSNLATDIFKSISKTKHGTYLSKEDWHSLASVLLSQGAYGSALHEALIDRVYSTDLNSVNLLLMYGASVDYTSGLALELAVAQEKTEYIDIILRHKPFVSSVNAAFARVDVLSRESRIGIARKLLVAGASGDVLDASLNAAITVPLSRRDRPYIQTLVQGGANVGQGDGDMLRLATRDSDYETLKILLQGHCSGGHLSTCVPLAMELEIKPRYKILKDLLQAGARGTTVSQALVDSIDGTSAGRQLTALLLKVGHANTAFDGGRAFRKALALSNLEFLEIMVPYNALDEAVFRSCLLVAINLPRDKARLEKTRLFLTASSDISGDTGIATMREEMQLLKQHGDDSLSMISVLLEAGASVSHNHGQIISDAIKMDLFACFELYLRHQISTQAKEASFETALVHALGTRDLRYTKLLLTANVSQRSLDEALVRSCKDGGNDALILLLLEYHASVNYREGTSIAEAILRLDLSLLDQLLHHAPSSPNLARAFKLCMDSQNVKARYEGFRLLLSAGEIPIQLRNDALVSAAEAGKGMVKICELLLKHDASPSYAEGTPICRAIKSSKYDVAILSLLVSFNPSVDAISAALRCAFAVLTEETRRSAMKLLLASSKPRLVVDQLLLEAVQESPCDHRLIKQFLEANASVLHRSGESVLHAVMKNDLTTLNTLEPHFAGKSSLVTGVFERAWNQGATAKSHTQALLLLLQSGVTGKCLNIALVETIKAFAFSSTALDFIVQLLRVGADVNYDHGASLVEAASWGDFSILKELFSHGPRRKNMARAFPHIFTTSLDAKTLDDMVVAFCTHKSRPVPNSPHSLGPVLFLLLSKYPTEKNILRYLIDVGYEADPDVPYTAKENQSLLCWALGESKLTLPEDIVDILLAAGADANYQTPLTHRTPLEIAISTSRSHSVDALLRAGADPLIETSTGRSPLSLAVFAGDRDIFRRLSQAGAVCNDGTLHQAAREVNITALQLLLEDGGQRDSPSSTCHGRTALAELCFRAGNTRSSQLKRAILLLKAYSDFTRKSNSKSILHYALDNPDPVPVTQALLDTFMSDFINDAFNLYEKDGLIYSPVAYVKRCQNTSHPSQRQALAMILEQFGCRDRFWATRGEQPVDAVGYPDDVAEIIREQASHHRRLARQREEDAEVRAGITAHHNLTIANQRATAAETAKIENAAADRHERNFRRLTELANQRTDDQSAREIKHRKAMGRIEQEQRDKTVAFDRQRRREEMKHVEAQQKVITAGFQDRLRIVEKSQENAAREQRLLMETMDEVDSLDEF